jgi:hypothetical protein
LDGVVEQPLVAAHNQFLKSLLLWVERLFMQPCEDVASDVGVALNDPHLTLRAMDRRF